MSPQYLHNSSADENTHKNQTNISHCQVPYSGKFSWGANFCFFMTNLLVTQFSNHENLCKLTRMQSDARLAAHA